MHTLRRYAAIVLILFVYTVSATYYSVVNPLFESPDEIWHYEYVRWLVEGNGLPEAEDVGHAPWHQEGSQPPLYYLAAAALTASIATDNADVVIRYNPHAAIGQAEALDNRNVMAHDAAQAWPWRGVTLAAHVVRLFSVALGMLTLWFTFATGRILFPGRPAIALTATVLVAFNPQFLFISAAVNNDNLVTMTSAATICLLSTLLVYPRQQRDIPVARLLLLGTLIGLAALSKLSGLLLAPFVGLVLVWTALRIRKPSLIVRWGIPITAAAALSAGWWYVRNQILFGDPLLLSAMFAILPRRPEPPTLTELIARGQGVWRSYWAVFGWFNVVVREWVYGLYTGITLLGLSGLLVVKPLRSLRGRTPGLDRPGDSATNDRAETNDRAAIILLSCWALMMLLLLIRWATMRYPQGRLLFPAISAFSLLIAYGLVSWLPTRAQRWAPWLPAAVMAPLALAIPGQWIAPVYTPPPAIVTPFEPPNPRGAIFDNRIELSGYELVDREIHKGGELSIQLYWRALQELPQDYSVFIHLTDENDILQVQRDSFPGGGTLPTLAWPTEQLIHDQHRLLIPNTAPAPARLKIDVGLYDHATQQRLLVSGQDHWTLGYITLLEDPSDSGFPNATHIVFGEKVALLGFDFDRRVIAPGDPLLVTLWWEALAEMDDEYKVFVHLVLPPQSTWAQKDEDPLNGDLLTTEWPVGRIIEDPYELHLPTDAPPGVYFVEIGLYNHDNDRLQVNFSDRGVVLGQVRVEGVGE